MNRPLSSTEPPPTWPEALASPARPSLPALCLDVAAGLVGLGLLGFVAWQVAQHPPVFVP